MGSEFHGPHLIKTFKLDLIYLMLKNRIKMTISEFVIN